MTRHSNPVAYFAWQSFVIFLTGTITMLSLDLAETSDLISGKIEAYARLAVFCLLLGFLLVLAHRKNIAPLIRTIVVFFAFVLIFQLVMGLTDDMRSLDGVALFGKGGVGHTIGNKLLTAIWTCCGFWLMYLLLKSSQELRTTNERLQCEIGHRETIQSALDEMNRTLEATVSERTKQLQDALDKLKSAQDKVIQQERLSAIGRLSSGITHELNNTLSPVVAYAELLCGQPTTDPQQREWLSSINQSASDAIDIIRELRQFHQPTENSRFEPIDLHSILEQVSARTRPRWKDESELCDRRIEFEMALDQVSMVRGNETELRQLFTNLVLNAIDAMSENGRIKVRLKEIDGDVIVNVSDTGSGMETDTLGHCFEPFFSTKQHGVGMGLSICHGIVRRHDGEITVESQPGHGTKFNISFRAIEAEKPLAQSDDTDPLPNLRVLCIDDNELARRSLAALLGLFGIEVVDAANGMRGLELLQEHDFDAVITDLGMSEMHGTDVVSAIKKRDPKMRVIVVSGWSAAEVEQQFRDRPMPDQIIEKPVNVETIRAALRRPQQHLQAN